MSRTALNQVMNASSGHSVMNTSSNRHADSGKNVEFDPQSEELYIASALYGTDGVKVTKSFRGYEAAERVRAAMNSPKNLTVLQEDSGEDSAINNHELFELGSPSGALVGPLISREALIINQVKEKAMPACKSSGSSRPRL